MYEHILYIYIYKSIIVHASSWPYTRVLPAAFENHVTSHATYFTTCSRMAGDTRSALARAFSSRLARTASVMIATYGPYPSGSSWKAFRALVSPSCCRCKESDVVNRIRHYVHPGCSTQGTRYAVLLQHPSGCCSVSAHPQRTR